MRNFWIELEDGTAVGSGVGTDPALKHCTVTESVNAGSELTLGSVCSACLEAEVLTRQDLKLAAGQRLRVFDGARQVGVFYLESPRRVSAHTCRITAYDPVSKLDRDLTGWLGNLTGWPYRLLDFARMVCAACGLELVTDTMTNGDLPVDRLALSSVTGRQLLRWVGEVGGCFCRANPQGQIELDWYADSGVTVTPTGACWYYFGSLGYEDAPVAPIDGVRLRLSKGDWPEDQPQDGGLLWPDSTPDNPYILRGNPLLTDYGSDTRIRLERIWQKLANLPRYTPCRVTVPAGQEIRAGQTVGLRDPKGRTVTVCVMTRIQSGQRDTLECTGSPTRQSTTASSNRTPEQIFRDQLDGMSQQQIFNKLTGGGKEQGLFLGEDGNVYLNVTYALAGKLGADRIDVENLVTRQLEAVSAGATLSVRQGAMRMSAEGSEVLVIHYDGAPMLALLTPQDAAAPRYTQHTAGETGWGTDATNILARVGVTEENGTARGFLEADTVHADAIATRSGTTAPLLFGKAVTWQDNGDGTYTLLGTDPAGNQSEEA